MSPMDANHTLRWTAVPEPEREKDTEIQRWPVRTDTRQVPGCSLRVTTETCLQMTSDQRTLAYLRKLVIHHRLAVWTK